MAEIYDPLVSIIITSLNREAFIGKAIDSALNQSYKNVEVIVVDGNSTDGTVDILRSYGDRIRWVSEEDDGESDANNKGVRLSKGEIVCFLPSDDMLTQDAVDVAVQTFRQSDENIAMVNGDGFLIDEEEHIIGFVRGAKLDVNYLVNDSPGRIIMSATFLRKTIVEEVGGWDTRIWFASDLDLWMRILENYACKYIQYPLSLTRRHSESLTVSRFRAALLDSFRVRRKYGGRIFSKATYRELRSFLRYTIIKKI